MVADPTVDLAPSADTHTIDDASVAPSRSMLIERGSTLGRYLVIDKVGEGGMGVVVRAYDPKLHREVALKRLHRDALGSDGETRLLREAQAMAQLSHPNVITIHDVERSEDGVVMAMELVLLFSMTKIAHALYRPMALYFHFLKNPETTA